MRTRQPSATKGISGDQSLEIPTLRIANRTLSARISPPDAELGYYRSTRFDWSGVLRDLRSRGHRYIAEWQPRHDPLLHDGITGPVDEFTQIGYEHVRPGKEFLKIGVGMLRKSSEEPYDRFKLYEIVEPGSRELIVGRDRVEFRHRLLSDEYGYDYRKTVLLTETPGFRIEYTLKNLGPTSLTGHVYNHNFFTLDRMETGVNTQIQFPFTPIGTWREKYDSVALTPDGIAFSRNLGRKETVFMGDLHSQDLAAQRYGFTLRNLSTGAGIRVAGSGQLSHMVFWASPSVACLEPYIPFRVYPGETGVWHIDYELLA